MCKCIMLLLTSMPLRSLRTQLAYNRYRKSAPDTCGFCELHGAPTAQLVETFDTMMLVRNRFPYSRWDGWEVAEHLMVVPKRHLTKLTDFNGEEAKEFAELLMKFDEEGYSFYHRSHANLSKTMPHVHGHLLRPAARR